MKFVDRQRETERLVKALSSNERQFIVVYGRRRIGKSTLIKQVLRLESLEDIYFQADETNTTNQLYLLAKAISSVFPSFDAATYPDWRALLDALNYRVKTPCTLCLDEFPYLCKSCPSLPSILQDFLDNASPQFNLIVCGSSQQLMHAEVLSERSPLYGRADVLMKIQPISISFIEEAMGFQDAKQAVEQYSLWGGIPRYWKLAKSEGDSAIDALSNLLLTPDGTLVDEPTRLLRDDLRDLTLSRSLMATIGYGANKLSDIASRMKKEATELSAPLKRLIDMGYVEREIPFGENTKNSKRSLYKIRDHFMNAYYKFYAPNASLIAMGRTDAVMQIVEKEISDYVGKNWEKICQMAVSGNEVDGIFYDMASRWWGSVIDKETGKPVQMEFDIVALSLDRKHLLLGECKWKQADYADRLLCQLNAKASLFPVPETVQHIHTKLFLKEPPLDGKNENIFLPEDVIAMCKP